MDCDWLMLGGKSVSGSFFPRTSSVVENVSTYGDRCVGKADWRQFWGLVLLADLEI